MSRSKLFLCAVLACLLLVGAGSASAQVVVPNTSAKVYTSLALITQNYSVTTPWRDALVATVALPTGRMLQINYSTGVKLVGTNANPNQAQFRVLVDGVPLAQTPVITLPALTLWDTFSYQWVKGPFASGSTHLVRIQFRPGAPGDTAQVNAQVLRIEY